MKKHPLVSIIMPVYNGSRFVEKAIESILAQTYPRLELIAVDDGSTDNTWHILKRYRKEHPSVVRVFRLKKNHGESTAANLAFTKARGAFIARMDADDVAQKNRLTKQVAFMNEHPEVITLGSQARVIDAAGRRIGAKRSPVTHEAIYTRFAYLNAMIHPTVIFRKRLLPKRDFLYRSTFESTDDYHTYFELLNYGQFANLPEELISYRVHGANKSLTNIKEKFWTDTKVRLTAVTKLNYRAPILMFPAIVLQALVVMLLPEALLREVFFYFRGMKRSTIKLPYFSFPPMWAKMKQYALSLR